MIHRSRALALALGFVSVLGCGSVDPAEPPDSGPPIVGDGTPPTVVSIDPADGASQVIDQAITIHFSEPMAQATVQAAFADATFSWNGDGTEVAITTAFPFAETPKAYTVTLPTTVTDAHGTPLAAAVTSTFALAALKTATIGHQGSLIGNHAAPCAYGTFLQTGDMRSDHPTCPNAIIYGGISFALADLPAHDAILELRAATVRTQVLKTAGEPGAAALGGLVVDHVTFASGSAIATAEVHQQAFATWFAAGPIETGAAVSLDVTAQLERSWSDAVPSFQLRVYPRGGSNRDAVTDLVYLRRGADENDGIVGEGVADPDAANRLRLEVQYFQ